MFDVQKETPEEINEIFGRRNLPAVLGSKSFVDRIKDSTVSSIVERVKYEMKVDKGLKNRIQDLADKFTKSQRQTW